MREIGTGEDYRRQLRKVVVSRDNCSSEEGRRVTADNAAVNRTYHCMRRVLLRQTCQLSDAGDGVRLIAASARAQGKEVCRSTMGNPTKLRVMIDGDQSSIVRVFR
jgi:hypothetical protein